MAVQCVSCRATCVQQHPSALDARLDCASHWEMTRARASRASSDHKTSDVSMHSTHDVRFDHKRRASTVFGVVHHSASFCTLTDRIKINTRYDYYFLETEIAGTTGWRSPDFRAVRCWRHGFLRVRGLPNNRCAFRRPRVKKRRFPTTNGRRQQNEDPKAISKLSQNNEFF